ncbi:hypothetical protein [Paenibacillus humicus]|uniref:hypothetical protein n=1 Tax=Paenibacillus humicus TaxID=412861 RepID=UPI003F158294
MFRPSSLASIVLLAVMAFFGGTALAAAPASSPEASKPLPPLSSGGARPVQIFDVAAGQVVRTLANSAEFQAVARQWLHDVQGMSPNFTPDDRCGYVFRIPLKEVRKVQLEKAGFEVQEVFLFYCRGKEPEMLAFDLKNKPYLLRVNTDVRPFLALAGFEPKS